MFVVTEYRHAGFRAKDIIKETLVCETCLATAKWARETPLCQRRPASAARPLKCEICEPAL